MNKDCTVCLGKAEMGKQVLSRNCHQVDLCIDAPLRSIRRMSAAIGTDLFIYFCRLFHINTFEFPASLMFEVEMPMTGLPLANAGIWPCGASLIGGNAIHMYDSERLLPNPCGNCICCWLSPAVSCHDGRRRRTYQWT